MTASRTISDYLIEQLYGHGVRYVFGIPGDYVLGFYDQLTRSRLEVINCCDEQGAGFAADGYARVRGLGAVCITYCVGGLKVVNATAEAFAEKSPVVVISGAPGMGERQKHSLLHHKVRDFDTQKKVFEQVTVASAALDDPQTAESEIDRVLAAALRHKQPVYLELPRDMVAVRGVAAHTRPESEGDSNPHALAEALDEAATMINSASKPVILAGVEIHRFGLQKELIALAQETGIPVAATILGKSVIAENHRFYLGVYEGATGLDAVRDYVESSDCLILLGAFMSDINLGIYTAKIDPARSINVSSEKLTIRYHTYENVRLADFMNALQRAGIRGRDVGEIPHPLAPEISAGASDTAITVKGLFERLNAFLKDTTTVVADVGDALFAAGDLFIHRGSEFLSPAYYTSMGFGVPAAIGVQLANPSSRPLVLVGDGAFQMTGMELSTAARYGLNPIVVVLNNRGYSTERALLDGPFNDLHPWQFSRVPHVLGAGRGFVVRTARELDDALGESERFTDAFCILDVQLDPHDSSPALQRLTERLSKRV